MTDPLGQSQVIPYLAGLSKEGYVVHLLSFEKKERFEAGQKIIGDLLKGLNITWHPTYYTKKPPIFSSFKDVNTMKSMTAKIIKKHRIELVHCRSAMTALTGLWAKENFGVRMIYDMRGFYAEERVDGKIWNLNNPLYYLVYKFFKRKEIEFIREADYTVSLTENGKNEILSWPSFQLKPPPIMVIPCCADLNHFSPENINLQQAADFKVKLNIKDDAYVLLYLGSLGTWYMVEEMVHFFSRLLRVKPNAIFLIISTDDKTIVMQYLVKYNVPEEKVIITSATRNEVPALLSLANFSLFFILPAYSKKASSPTKLAELMGLSIPVVCNTGVGDVDQIVSNANAGIVLKDFKEGSIDKAIVEMLSFSFDASQLREAAFGYASLDTGIRRYKEIYSVLLGD